MKLNKNYTEIKRYIKYILFILLVLFIALLYCWTNNWAYWYFDIMVKFISGVGTIIAGLFVYKKWQDEKTRNLYERRLQEVYAPLISILVKEKNDREIYAMVGMVPDEEESGYQLYIYRNKDIFTNFFDQNKWGLADPKLLVLYIGYQCCLSNYCEGHLKGINWFTQYDAEAYSGNCMLDEKCQKIERELIQTIINKYNDCLERLELDKQRIKIEDVLFSNWEGYSFYLANV